MAFNPFAGLHYNLAGGRNKLILAAGAFLLMMCVGWYVAYSSTVSSFPLRHGRLPSAVEISKISSETSAGTLGWVAGAECLFLLLMVPLAVRKAVVADATSGMLESHRLTPLSGVRIAFGYLASAPILAYCLCAAAVLLGSWLAIDAGRLLSLPPATMLQHWFSGQALLLMMTFLLASAALLFALHAPGKKGAPLMVFFFLGGGSIIQLVPGLRLLLGFATASIIFSAVRSGLPSISGAGPSLLASALAQIAFSVLFFAAAARKVRVVGGSLFGLHHGLLLVLLFAAVTVVAICVMPSTFRFGDPDLDALSVQIGASLVVVSLLAYAPLAAAADQQNASENAAAFGERRSARSRSYILTIPLLLTALMSAMVMLGSRPDLFVDLSANTATPVAPGAFTIPAGTSLPANFQLPPEAIRHPDGSITFNPRAIGPHKPPEKPSFFSFIGDGALPLAILLMLVMDIAIFVLCMRNQRAAMLWVGIAYVLFRVLPLMADGIQEVMEEIRREASGTTAANTVPGSEEHALDADEDGDFESEAEFYERNSSAADSAGGAKTGATATSAPVRRKSPLFFGQISPLGTAVLCLARAGNPWPGLAIQALITGFFLTLWYRGLPKPIPDARPA
ncbi:MAG: hypothetical protein SF069_12090 [Phycisphaerae bacterium]|nr:hypothetical protein [Phycisphaerae bacterium]